MTRKTVKLLGMIWALLILIILIFIGSVRAMDTPKSIDQQIIAAQKILVDAEYRLSCRDREKFFVYKQNPFSVDGHLAELELRKKYPEEYSKYIAAKLDLDDLLYLRFIIVANGVPEGDK